MTHLNKDIDKYPHHQRSTIKKVELERTAPNLSSASSSKAIS
jgi:hypothetical protein